MQSPRARGAPSAPLRDQLKPERATADTLVRRPKEVAQISDGEAVSLSHAKRAVVFVVLGACLAAFSSIGQPGAAAAEPAKPGVLKLAKLRAYTRTCKGEVTRDSVKGEPRFACQRRGGVPSLFEAIGPEHRLTKVTLMVSVSSESAAESLLMALTFLRDATGKRPGDIMPDGFLEGIGTGEQSFTHGGLIIESEPYPSLGMIRFTVAPAS